MKKELMMAWTIRIGVAVMSMVLWASAVGAQVIVTGGAVTGGVALSPEGVIQVRNLTEVIKLDKEAKGRVYVSLPRLMDEVKRRTTAGEPIPEELKSLGGLTRIEYVQIFPADKDIVISGPREDLSGGDIMMTRGKATGRPTLQLDDLVVAMRLMKGKEAAFYGCSLETAENAASLSDEVAKKYGAGPRKVLIEQMKKGIGPQKVVIYGVPENSRMALAMVAADFRLKRMTMGLESVAGVGDAVVGSGSWGCRFWFEPAYEPLLVSKDGLNYELRGPRLCVKTGMKNFEQKGATRTAETFATKVTEKMEELAKADVTIADLQNVSDMLVLAALIKQDRLEEKAGCDLSWLGDVAGYQPLALPTPKTAETQVNVKGNAVASGGVSLRPSGVIATSKREEGGKEIMEAARKRPTEQWEIKVK